MIEFENTAVVITASMADRALPGKPMMDVNGQPLIARALAAAEAAKLGKVLVAAGDNNIADAVRRAGGIALVASPIAGAGNVAAAQILALRDEGETLRHVLVLPCSLLAIDPLDLRRCLAGLLNTDVDLATIAAYSPSPRVGQTLLAAPLEGEREVAYLRGLAAVGGETGKPALVHIPVFAWTRAKLNTFATLRPPSLEAALRPEIERAHQSGLRCAVVKVDSEPLSVDTPQELELLRRQLKA